MILARILSLALGYCLGLIQTGYIYGKSKKIDIREHGSGNAGTTNTLRVLGWKAGVITFAGDLCKAMLAVLIAWLIFRNRYPESVVVLKMYAGLGAVLGHNYPFYLKFKGGKGIACTSGFVLATFLITAPVCTVLFVVPLLLSGYVSLGSILLVSGFLIQLVLFGQLGILGLSGSILIEVYILGAIFTGLALWKHRENIQRLLKGTENRFARKNKE